jgi:hypothetical protein
MLVVTSDEGVLVGNGPAVSDEVAVQFPDVEVEPVVVVPVEEFAASPLQALIIGMTKDPNPNKPNPFKNSFLSIANTLLMLQL